MELIYVQALTRLGKKNKSDRLTFIDGKLHPGRPIGLNGEERANITAIACSELPVGYARWSLSLLVELEIVESNLIQTVRQHFKKNELQPHRKR
ncbi:MAG: hypothetical protein NXI23_00005 [Bacteroidetes bacterium]|jgi:hypothetical protein|nr:hypothetical protein [Bacteroidota bacterium]MDF1864167.1 hypothetical protein [Saprospiraceae bacterium]